MIEYARHHCVLGATTLWTLLLVANKTSLIQTKHKLDEKAPKIAILNLRTHSLQLFAMDADFCFPTLDSVCRICL